jgi:hypothetical protein
MTPVQFSFIVPVVSKYSISLKLLAERRLLSEMLRFANGNGFGPISICRRCRGGLDESTATGRHRLSRRGKSGASRANRHPAHAIHR